MDRANPRRWAPLARQGNPGRRGEAGLPEAIRPVLKNEPIPPPPAPAWQRLNWPGVWAPLAAFGAYLLAALIFGVAGMTYALSRGHPSDALPKITVLAWSNLGALVVLGAVSLVLLAGANPGRGPGVLARLAGDIERRDWLLVGVLFVAVVPAELMLAIALGGRIPMDPVLIEALSHPASKLGAVLVAPVSEELWGRGLVYGTLSRWGPWVALAGTTLITSFIHLDPLHMLTVLPGMAAMSWLRFKTGRLAPSVALHAANNLFSVLGSSLVP
ncbi:MAG: CPBP family intramembrane metalloprotease [Bacillota bacterium]|nr:MAG: CPBP family intramembrane metalloprotease [Bacillota bacterium]